MKFFRLFERYLFLIFINLVFLKFVDVFRVVDVFKEGWIVNLFLKLEVIVVDSYYVWNLIVLLYFLFSFFIFLFILGLD